MGTEIKFKIGGQEVSEVDFKDKLRKGLFQRVRDRLSQKISSVQCPEHKLYATVTVEGEALDKKLSFHIFGCCDKLRDEVRKALRS